MASGPALNARDDAVDGGVGQKVGRFTGGSMEKVRTDLLFEKVGGFEDAAGVENDAVAGLEGLGAAV